MTAVCVDDDALMLAQIVSCCRAHRLLTDVQAFTSSPEALAWLKDHTVDLALLDVNMPDMNGLELAGEIRRLHPQTAAAGAGVCAVVTAGLPVFAHLCPDLRSF